MILVTKTETALILLVIETETVPILWITELNCIIKHDRKFDNCIKSLNYESSKVISSKFVKFQTKFFFKV